MANILGKIFSVGAEKLVGALGDAFDKNFTNKEERAQAEAEMQRIVTAHVQEMEKLSNETLKIEVGDRASARTRETDFVKATGHIDYMMYILAGIGLLIFGYLVYSLLYLEVPEKNEGLIIHTLGIIEGIIVSLYSYYFGSSAGSRLKDMRDKTAK